MGFICGAIDFTGLKLFAVAKLLFEGHDGLQGAMGIDQGDLRAFVQGCSLLIGGCECDGYRPG